MDDQPYSRLKVVAILLAAVTVPWVILAGAVIFLDGLIDGTFDAVLR